MLSDEVLAALITAVGSIVAAVIAAATASVGERTKSGALAEGSRWRWLRRFGYPVALVTIGIMAAWVFSLIYDGTYSRLAKALPNLPDYKKRIYANVGLGFVYPTDWQVEDYAFRFGGGDMELVSGRSPNGLIDTQGVVIGIENIAAHHWADPQSQYVHFEEGLKKRCTKWTHEKAAFAGGQDTDLFTCSRIVDGFNIDERTYWYQLVPSACLRLKIRSWSDLHDELRARFDGELSQFLKYFRLDNAKIESLIAGKKTGCADPSP